MEAQAHRRLPQAQPARAGDPPRRRAARPAHDAARRHRRSRAPNPGRPARWPAKAASPSCAASAPTRSCRANRGSRAGCGPRAGGSAFPLLCDEDQAPNVAILFAHPLGEDIINRRFEPEFAQALAARSALGSPAVYGLLMRVRDLLLAERTFTQVRRRQAAHRPRGRPDAAARPAHGRPGRSDGPRLGQLPRVALRGAARPGLAAATVRGTDGPSALQPMTAAAPAAARVRSSPTSAARRAR